MTGSSTERAIAGHERGVERLGKREVHRVVRRKVLTQLPRPPGEIEMPMSGDPKQREVFNRLGRAIGRHLTGLDESPHRAENLDVEKMWRVEVPGLPDDARLDEYSTFGPEQQLLDRRRADDDHADSRSF